MIVVYIFKSGEWGFNYYSAGVDFSRQNPTSVDVRFWRLKSIPHGKKKNMYTDRRPIT